MHGLSDLEMFIAYLEARYGTYKLKYGNDDAARDLQALHTEAKALLSRCYTFNETHRQPQ